jgi:putative lipase involved disintegration of autophagic bodies
MLTRVQSLPIAAISLAISAVAAIALGQTKPDDAAQPQAIAPATAAKYAAYAMMSSNAYHKTDWPVFAVEKLGWVLIDRDGKPTRNASREHRDTGLAYDIYEKQRGDEVVFAFRGTDSKRDYLFGNFSVPPLSRQYSQANREVADYAKDHPKKKLTVTGHSLGGGIALGVSVHHGVDAVTFDSSPRIFDGLGERNLPATRVLIYQDGEILEHLRKHWRKMSEIIPKENVYRCTFDFGGANTHRSDQLARGLLELGSTASEELAAVRDALPAKP